MIRKYFQWRMLIIAPVAALCVFMALRYGLAFAVAGDQVIMEMKNGN